MKKLICSSIIFTWLTGASFMGMDHWYHPHQISLSGAGGTFNNVSSDISNPAGLWSLPRSFNVGVVSYPADIITQSAHLSLPGNEAVTVYGIRHLNYGLFEGKNDVNEKTSDFYASDTWFSWAAAGHSSNWPLLWGVSVGLFYSSIEHKEAIAITYSVGSILVLEKLDAKLGIAIMNGGTVIKKYTSFQEDLPTVLLISFAKELEYLPLTLSADVFNRFNDDKIDVKLGGLFDLPNNIKLKFGTSSNRVKQSVEKNFSKDLLADTGFGIGWEYENYHFETGFYSYGPGGWMSGLSVGIQF